MTGLLTLLRADWLLKQVICLQPLVTRQAESQDTGLSASFNRATDSPVHTMSVCPILVNTISIDTYRFSSYTSPTTTVITFYLILLWSSRHILYETGARRHTTARW